MVEILVVNNTNQVRDTQKGRLASFFRIAMSYVM